MKKFRPITLMVAVVLAVVAGVCIFSSSDAPKDENAETTAEARHRRIASARKQAKVEKNRRKSRKNRSSVPVVVTDEGEHEKPNLALDMEDEIKLTKEMRELYHELQKALDNNNRREVIALVRKLQASKEWPDGIPRSVKLRALDALSWFGAAGMAEAVSFLGDADPEVVESAVDKFSAMLSESDLGDRATAEILKQIVKVVHDRDALDTFLNEMNNMRNSVRADMALAVFDSGNPDAVAVLEENIDFLFCDNQADYEVKTREDVVKYGQDNPDGEDDDDFYGPPETE